MSEVTRHRLGGLNACFIITRNLSSCITRTFTAFILFWLLAGISLAQQTIRVPADAATIQSAIDAAVNGDTVLVSSGTYYENLDFKGKAITVTSDTASGATAATTLISGAAGATVTFQANEPAATVLNGFTITHQSPAGQTPSGPGIYIAGASPTISANSILENNGCGVSIIGPTSSPAIRNNQISWNFTGVPAALPGCGDMQNPLDDGIGIGIFRAGVVEITGNNIEGNGTLRSVSGGGGITSTESTSVVILNNTIHGNTGHPVGGDSGNSTRGDGFGGIFVMGIGSLSIIQNLIYANIVVNNGPAAGIHIQTSDIGNHLPTGAITLLNNTVVDNQGSDTFLGVGGSQLSLLAWPASATIENNIFARASDVDVIGCVPGANAGFRFNDVVGPTLTQRCGASINNNINADPQFVNTAANDFHLTAQSAALAAGNPSVPNLPATDLDGLPRLLNNTISLGVYQYQPHAATSPTLTSSANPAYVSQPVTFTATLNPATVPSLISGAMSFHDGSVALGTVNVGASGVASWTSDSLAAGGHSVYAVYSGNPTLAAGISNTVPQQIVRYNTTTTLTAAQSSGVYGAPVLFTATVQAPQSSTPVAGKIVFYNNGYWLGATDVTNGSASFTTKALQPGANAVTATFQQSTGYTASTSNAVSVAITYDFALAATPQAQTIFSGQSATFNLVVSSDSGFDQPITFTCSGLPVGSSCSFAPAALQSGVGSTQLVVQIPSASNAGLSKPSMLHSAPLLCVLVLLPFARRKRRLLMALLLTGSLYMSGCNATLRQLPPLSSNAFVVTGTSNVSSAVVAHSITLTVSVKSQF